MKALWLVPLVVVPLLSAAVPGPSADLEHTSPLPCQVAEAWVESNRQNLPTTLNELRAFDRAHQVAIINALPVDDLVPILSDRLVEIRKELVTELGQLNSEQHALLTELAEDLELIVLLTSTKDWYTRIVEAFPDSYASFGTLVVESPDQVGEYCDCNEGLWSCNDITGPDRECVVEEEGCTPTSRGCGFMFSGPCIGMCLLKGPA